MPILSAINEITTAVKIVYSIYEILKEAVGASEDYQCLIEELRSFEQALKTVEFAITLSPPTGHVALNIATETTTCLEMLKKFKDRIRSFQKNLGGRKGAYWPKICWSQFKKDEIETFRQRISQHKHNISIFFQGLTV